MARQLDLAQALGLAFSHLDAGRLVEAGRLARDLDRASPTLPGLAYLRGLLALAAGDGRKAAQQLAKALAQTPGAPPPLLAMARAQRLQGRLDDAEAFYRRLLGVAPDNAEALAELAELLLRIGRSAEAVEPLRRLVAARPLAPTAWNNLGAALMALGRQPAAEACFAAALQIDPGQAKALANLAALWRRSKAGGAVAAARRAIRLQPDEAGHWLELACAATAAGRADEGFAAFAEAARLAPQSAEIAWLWGKALAEAGHRDEAAAQYRRVVELAPDDRFGAGLALARLGAAAAPGQAPAAFVQALFDRYAETYDRDLVETLAYTGPQRLAEAIVARAGRGPFDILDIGCGTGLAGVTLKPLARRLDGVDLSPQMVDKAAGRQIYDDLAVGDLVAVMAARPQAYDLVAAADVLIYLGDLAPVFAAAAAALRPAGHLVFTVEAGPNDAAGGFVLQESGRYAHAPAYLRRTAEAAGLALVQAEPASVRREHGSPVPALICVAAKG